MNTLPSLRPLLLLLLLFAAATAVMAQEPTDVQETLLESDPVYGSEPPLVSGEFRWPTAATLWDNGPLVNSPGTGVGGADESVLQNVSLGMTTLGFGHQVLSANWVADNFVVGAAEGWTVTSMTFFAYQTGSATTSTMTDVPWTIFDGQPGAGGTPIFAGNGLNNSVWSNIYRVTETTSGTATNRPIMASTTNVNFFLPTGSYWVAWQTDGTLASGPWAPPITQNGQATTGNGLQSTNGGATWGAALDNGTGTQQGFPFIVSGSVGGGESEVYLPSIQKLADGCFLVEQEPNNTFPTANNPICLGQLVSGAPNDEWDVFQFFSVNVGTITIDMSNYTGGDGQLFLFYESSANQVGFAGGEPYEISYFGQPGTYYVAIFTGSDYNPWPYFLHVMIP